MGTLSRAIQPMPDEIRQLLISNQLMGDYQNRPHYQQNDYLAWIARAKQSTTRTKRINQMLDELRRGGIYMNMDHPPSQKN